MNSSRALLLSLVCTLWIAGNATADTPAVSVEPPNSQETSALSDETGQETGMLLLSQEQLTSDGNLDIGKAAANVTFKVSYPSFGPGHKVALRWEGPTVYSAPLQTTASTSPLTYYVPKATVAAAFNGSARVTYSIEIPGAPAFTSEPLTVGVTLDRLVAPVAPLAEDGKLDVGKAPLQVPFMVGFSSLAAGEKVTLAWAGSVSYKTAAQTTTSTAPLTFNVPRDVIAKDLGGSATLTYAVEIAGVPVQTSEPLNLQIQFNLAPPPRFPLATGMESAKELNARYAAVPQRCDNLLPAYYCSGVLLRGVATARRTKPSNPDTDRAKPLVSASKDRGNISCCTQTDMEVL
jgi:hypothetical protein